MAEITRQYTQSISSLVTGQQGIYTQINENMQKLAALTSGVISMEDSPLSSPEDPGVYIVKPADYTVTINEGSDYVTYSGDLTSRISGSDIIILKKTDGTMHQFTVASISYSSPNTTIYTNEDISGGSWSNDMFHADGDFNGHEWAIGHYYDSTWHFYDPTIGQLINLIHTDSSSGAHNLYYFNGDEWIEFKQASF